jgi:hypothetical protein
LKRYPHLIQQLEPTNDLVPAWTILRNVVIRQLEQHLANELKLTDFSGGKSHRGLTAAAREAILQGC